jgi:hypothetical protein
VCQALRGWFDLDKHRSVCQRSLQLVLATVHRITETETLPASLQFRDTVLGLDTASLLVQNLELSNLAAFASVRLSSGCSFEPAAVATITAFLRNKLPLCHRVDFVHIFRA